MGKGQIRLSGLGASVLLQGMTTLWLRIKKMKVNNNES